MKPIVVLAGLLMAASLALADEVGDSSNDPYAGGPARPDAPRLITETATQETRAEPDGPPADNATAARDRLLRKAVITVDGDEIGVINDVGYSASRGEHVALVDIDEFIGIGAKRIAIPLTQLQATDVYSNTVMTLFTRDAIEAEEAFDEADFTPIE